MQRSRPEANLQTHGQNGAVIDLAQRIRCPTWRSASVAVIPSARMKCCTSSR
jgi:hypothetical protein